MLYQLFLAGATGTIAVIYVLGFKVLANIIKSYRSGTPVKESILTNTKTVFQWITLTVVLLTLCFIALAILAAIFAE